MIVTECRRRSTLIGRDMVGGKRIDARAADFFEVIGGGIGVRRGGRKFDGESAALTGLAFDADSAAVLLENFLAHG